MDNAPDVFPQIIGSNENRRWLWS